MTTIDTTATATDHAEDSNGSGRVCYLRSLDTWTTGTDREDDGTVETPDGIRHRNACVLLPRPGEYVSLVAADGHSVAGYWTDNGPLSVAGATVTVRLLHPGTPTRFTRVTVPVANADVGVCLSQSVGSLDTARTMTMLADGAQALDALVRDAYTAARENNWCSVFTDLMDRHGIEQPVRTFDLRVDVQLRNVWLSVDATDLDDAREQIDGSMIRDALDTEDVDLDTLQLEERDN